jgi:hypothetical protein
MKGEAEVKIMAGIRPRPAEDHHTIISDDSDVTLISLCMPAHLNITVCCNSHVIYVHEVTAWILANCEAAGMPAEDIGLQQERRGECKRAPSRSAPRKQLIKGLHRRAGEECYRPNAQGATALSRIEAIRRVC